MATKLLFPCRATVHENTAPAEASSSPVRGFRAFVSVIDTSPHHSPIRIKGSPLSRNSPFRLRRTRKPSVPCRVQVFWYRFDGFSPTLWWLTTWSAKSPAHRTMGISGDIHRVFLKWTLTRSSGFSCAQVSTCNLLDPCHKRCISGRAISSPSIPRYSRRSDSS